MNYDEFAFFNQQLAAMLRQGIPLEGALKHLCAGMSSGPLRAEIERLEADLARGVPLKEALDRRELPDLYRQMMELGARSNDLPGVLTLLADHYHRANALWTRLKGLMVYPLLVILTSLGLTILISVNFSRFLEELGSQGASALFSGGFVEGRAPWSARLVIPAIWTPPPPRACNRNWIGGSFRPSWRARLRWRLPVFRDASLAQLASAMSLMLRNGTTLPEALSLAEALESGTPAAKALARWRQLVAAGQGKPTEWQGDTRPFPPLFLWLVQKGGEDLAAGFQQAAEIFQARASYRIELALYGALPISILLLGQMILWQTVPLARSLIWIMNAIGAG